MNIGSNNEIYTGSDVEIIGDGIKGACMGVREDSSVRDLEENGRREICDSGRFATKEKKETCW